MKGHDPAVRAFREQRRASRASRLRLTCPKPPVTRPEVPIYSEGLLDVTPRTPERDLHLSNQARTRGDISHIAWPAVAFAAQAAPGHRSPAARLSRPGPPSPAGSGGGFHLGKPAVDWVGARE